MEGKVTDNWTSSVPSLQSKRTGWTLLLWTWDPFWFSFSSLLGWDCLTYVSALHHSLKACDLSSFLGSQVHGNSAPRGNMSWVPSTMDLDGIQMSLGTLELMPGGGEEKMLLLVEFIECMLHMRRTWLSENPERKAMVWVCSLYTVLC